MVGRTQLEAVSDRYQRLMMSIADGKMRLTPLTELLYFTVIFNQLNAVLKVNPF
ncbi:MAG: hypothetical protein KME45_04955 [Stenomitos rutilans HA7619-LM2]|nr:hypothetical protein [Stenomitos rutilans HA7619-LM2]